MKSLKASWEKRLIDDVGVMFFVFSGILGLFSLCIDITTPLLAAMCYRFFCFSLLLLLSRNSNSWCGEFFFCVYIICCEWINKFFFVRLLLSAAAAIWKRSNERGNLSKKSRLCSDYVFFAVLCCRELASSSSRWFTEERAERAAEKCSKCDEAPKGSSSARKKMSKALENW